MAGLGLSAYRFSVSWPRVIPGGTGKPSEAGLGFYDRLVDLLLESDIQPWLTLYHWDLPIELHHRGGWLNREIVDWFEAYTRVIVDRLSDRVQHWITINEPQIFLELGYGTGKHAPGATLPFADRLRASHHALLAHGAANRVIRERAKKLPSVGWAPVGIASVPDTETPENIEAVRNEMFRAQPGLWSNSWFADPVCLGAYPEDGVRLFGSDMPRIEAGDLERIAEPIDFYGVNIYTAQRLRATGDGGVETVDRPAGAPQTAFGWPIEPDALYWGPRLLYERYGVPIVVTENGMSQFDAPTTDGRILDHARIDFLQRYLASLGRAISDGTEVLGYFHWSLLDNFEWAEGYAQRFGLIYVDFDTLERTPKLSAAWYAEFIKRSKDGGATDAVTRAEEAERIG